MGMRPEEMERWGTAFIFKESATLLHEHYRVLLAIVLVYYLPISILIVYETLFYSPSSTPLLDASVDKGSINIAQTTDPPDALSFDLSIIKQWTIFFLNIVMGAFGARAKSDAESARTAYQNTRTPIPIDDDRSIVPKVVEFPHLLLLRRFITEFYAVLAFLFLSSLSLILGGILQAIILATAGWSDPKLFFNYGLVLAYIIGLAIAFALLQVILVLVYWSREIRERSAETEVV